METFLTEYRKQLAANIAADPVRYTNAIRVNGSAEALIESFANSIRRQGIRGMVLESPTLKAVCKALRIKHTYKAMEHFIANHK